MVKPGFETCSSSGLAQPLPTLVNFAEQQSKLVAGSDRRPLRVPRRGDDGQGHGRGRGGTPRALLRQPRHRMQVDFNTYVADLAKEIAAGKERAAGQAVGAANSPVS